MRIIGLVLKSYKCYENVNVVYFGTSGFTGIIGDNGVGKSSALEALQFFFTEDKDFFSVNRSSRSSSADTYVAPIIATNSIFSESFNQIQKIPESIRNEIVSLGLDKVIIPGVTGINEPILVELLSNGSAKIISSIESELSNLREFIKTIRREYTYVYIPAELPIDYATQVQSNFSELITGENLRESLKDKIPPNIKDEINLTLSNYTTDNIINPLKDIDERYDYKSLKGKTSRASLTQKVLAEMLVEVYFKDRGIYFDSNSIEDLSSGQRRRAFIDYIVALLKSTGGGISGKLILAIDEPEISCDAVARYEQFARLISLQGIISQLIVTTHWYGWILQQKNGNLALLSHDPSGSGKINATIYNTNEYPFKASADIPYDLRSYTDFLVSLGSLAQRFPDIKYIICEGPSDKNFLEKTLSSSVYHIVVGGTRDMVNKLYEFWKMQWKNFSEPSNVKFLVDTDHGVHYTQGIYRVMRSQSLEYSISNTGSSEGADEVADIEDLLEMQDFLTVLLDILNSDPMVTQDDKDFIGSLTVKHPELQGKASLGLSDVEKIRFKTIYKGERKLKVSEGYNPTVEDTFLKRNIETIFQ